MMLTTFSKTKEMHRVAGVYFPNTPQKSITTDEIKLGLGLIAEEFVELLRDGFGLEGSTVSQLEGILKTSIAQVSDKSSYDLVEVADALGDLDVVINRLGGVLGLDMNAVSDEIYASNMSKFTESLGEAVIAEKDYKAKGRNVTIHEVPNGDKAIYVVKDSATGKVLKASSFKEPNLKRVLGV